jgi:hypothetical protein
MQDRPEAEQFVLGGCFALKHYLDYRHSGDVDAWWRSCRHAQALAVAREAFARTAAEFGYSVHERAWGETILLEMMALVARGAPCDFADIKQVVDAGLISQARCWELWVTMKAAIEPEDARDRVQTHLARINARTHGEGSEDEDDRADYVRRICSTCDFGVPPDRDSVALFASGAMSSTAFRSPIRRRIMRCAPSFDGPPCRRSRASIPHRGKLWTHSMAETIPARTSSSPSCFTREVQGLDRQLDDLAVS